MHFINCSNICILNHATGFLIFLFILGHGRIINSNTTTTSSVKFHVFFTCHMWNVFSSATFITIRSSNHKLFLCAGYVNEHIVFRAVLGTTQPCVIWRRHGFFLKELTRRIKDVYDDTQISIPNISSFRFSYLLEGFS